MRARVLAGGLAALLLLPLASVSSAVPESSVPSISLRRSTGEVIAYKYGKGPAYLRAPVYVQAKEAPFDLRVRRINYKSPLILHQVFHKPNETEWVELGSDYLDGWRGLRDFTRIVVQDSDGKVVYSATKRFCPNNWDRQRVDDSGATNSVYPGSCYGRDRSFLKGMAWGIEEGWAVPLTRSIRLDVKPGDYEAKVRITRQYRDLFGIADSAAVARFGVKVEKVASGGGGGEGPESHALSEDETSEPTTARTIRGSAVDPSFLPDIEALPAFRMRVRNQKSGKSRLEFAATIWTGGNSPLVVEGFRRDDEDTMDAYQYFYDGDEVVGRAPVGTFEYDRRDGHFHWHIQQFVRYQIRSIASDKVVRSSKQSFCLVPTDAVDLSLDNALWDGESGNLHTSCGGPDALWIREVLPIGWGDTYSQVAGQAFNITSLPNGEYWVEVEANPEGLLHEQDTDNNLTRRKVILKGSPGNRRIVVRNWHGIDF